MAKPRQPSPEPESAKLSMEQVRLSLPKLKRRIQELKTLDVNALTEENGSHTMESAETKVNATLREVFGANTIEYNEYQVQDLVPHLFFVGPGTDTSFQGRKRETHKNVQGAIKSLETVCDILQEKLDEGAPDAAAQVLRAYEGLALHPEITRASSKRYLDGHYADAVEAAVKALNDLVRLRSGTALDGTKLMETVFSANNPVLKFNAMADQSDKDEQKGFMMMFSGAVSGLRNPRAHKFIQDDPERALEFIAFVSLLAKLLDGSST